MIDQIICGDCLEVMSTLEDNSVDMVLADLPYGVTACKWDTPLPLDALWVQFKRIRKNWLTRGNDDCFIDVRNYLYQEKQFAHLTNKQVNQILGVSINGGGMACHYFPKKINYDQWMFPNKDAYQKLQTTGYFQQDYEELFAGYLKENKKYEDKKSTGAPTVLFGTEPFSSYLRISNINEYKYDWIWRKEHGTGIQLATKRPLMETENISLFQDGKTRYNPIMEKLDKPVKYSFASSKSDSCPIGNYKKGQYFATERFPKNLLEFKRDTPRIHPTQKPAALFEYLIRTYTNEGDTVLDPTAGSGTTAVACHKSNRHYICIEKEPEYCAIAEKRLAEML